MGLMSIDDGSMGDFAEVLRPIVSLVGKSEKAQQKLMPGTWQHTMLGDNLQALRIASNLMTKEGNDAVSFAPDELRKAKRALDSMIKRSETAQRMFLPGTSQHTLQRNRLRSLCFAYDLIDKTLDASGSA
jgi:hypothetical protein